MRTTPNQILARQIVEQFGEPSTSGQGAEIYVSAVADFLEANKPSTPVAGRHYLHNDGSVVTEVVAIGPLPSETGADGLHWAVLFPRAGTVPKKVIRVVHTDSLAEMEADPAFLGGPMEILGTRTGDVPAVPVNVSLEDDNPANHVGWKEGMTDGENEG